MYFFFKYTSIDPSLPHSSLVANLQVNQIKLDEL